MVLIQNISEYIVDASWYLFKTSLNTLWIPRLIFLTPAAPILRQLFKNMEVSKPLTAFTPSVRTAPLRVEQPFPGVATGPVTSAAACAQRQVDSVC